MNIINLKNKELHKAKIRQGEQKTILLKKKKNPPSFCEEGPCYFYLLFSFFWQRGQVLQALAVVLTYYLWHLHQLGQETISYRYMKERLHCLF